MGHENDAYLFCPTNEQRQVWQESKGGYEYHNRFALMTQIHSCSCAALHKFLNYTELQLSYLLKLN